MQQWLSWLSCNILLLHVVQWEKYGPGSTPAEFLEWANRAKLYQEILSPEAVQSMQQWLSTANDAEQRELLEALQAVHADINPAS